MPFSQPFRAFLNELLILLLIVPGRAEQGLESNALSWVDVTAHTAHALSAEMTPPRSGNNGKRAQWTMKPP